MKIVFTWLLLLSFISVFSQDQIVQGKYLVRFADRKNSPYSFERPEEFLSQRAILRRAKYQIPITVNDLPVNPNYVDSLRNLGFTIFQTYKWLNAVCIQSPNNSSLDVIKTLSFVNQKPISFQKKTITSVVNLQQADLSYNFFLRTTNNRQGRRFLPPYYESSGQVLLHHGQVLHRNGYTGNGLHVAVLDAGFFNVNKLDAFDSLWIKHKILGYYDFVDKDTTVFNDGFHGLKVLSTMAAILPMQFYGTAPDASYWLMRTENHYTETLIEEFNWLAAAEFVDSAGVDLINSSLGYNDFDEKEDNYGYSDLDGNRSFIAQAADIAASKGILVVVSAGNEGDDEWQYITTPADADSVLTVGAVGTSGRYATFSSTGPTSDGRMKPDVVATGYATRTIDEHGLTSAGFGTSFSSPVMAGLVTCLWQAAPNLSNMQIIQLLRQSSNRYVNPNNLMGYGIPDMRKATLYLMLSANQPNNATSNMQSWINGNPAYDNRIAFTNSMEINLFNAFGQKVKLETSTQDAIRKSFSDLPKGVYLLQTNLFEADARFLLLK